MSGISLTSIFYFFMGRNQTEIAMNNKLHLRSQKTKVY